MEGSWRKFVSSFCRILIEKDEEKIRVSFWLTAFFLKSFYIYYLKMTCQENLKRRIFLTISSTLIINLGFRKNQRTIVYQENLFRHIYAQKYVIDKNKSRTFLNVINVSVISMKLFTTSHTLCSLEITIYLANTLFRPFVLFNKHNDFKSAIFLVLL